MGLFTKWHSAFALFAIFSGFVFIAKAESPTNSLIGKSIYSLLPPSTLKEGVIFLKNGVTVKVHKGSESSTGRPVAHVRVEGEEYNLFYFHLDDEGKITEMGKVGLADAGARVAIAATKDIPLFQDLAKIYNIVPDDNDVLAFELRKKELAEKKKREDSVQQKKDFDRSEIADSDDACLVSQAEFAVASASEQKALKTFGAGPCAIVAIYDENNKVGALAHIDGLTSIDASLGNMDYALKDKAEEQAKSAGTIASAPSYKVYLIGGDISSREMLFNLQNSLQSRYPDKIKLDILTGKTEEAWLDLATGTVSSFIVNPSLSSNQINLDTFSLMRPTESPLKQLFLKQKCNDKKRTAPPPAERDSPLLRIEREFHSAAQPYVQGAV